MNCFEPVYYSTFKCIADKCQDNCCIGWEIDIDNNTLKKYKRVEGEFGKKLKNGITKCDNTHCFKLNKKERCVFLNENNLCDIIINLGKENLCQICTNHPRYINEYLNITEYGLGISCEEVCRIILSQQEPVYLIDSETKDKITENPFKNNYYMAYLFEIRKIITNTLQNRSYKINQRLFTVVKLCYKVEIDCHSDKSDNELLGNIEYIKSYAKFIFTDTANFDNKNVAHKKDFQFLKKLLCNIINDYISAEILDLKWMELLQNTLNYLNSQSELQFINAHTKFEKHINTELLFENFLIYLIYRYFLESYYDDMITEKALFLLSSYIVIKEIFVYIFSSTLSLTFEDIIEIIHNYSKEIEYSDCNLNYLCNCYSSKEAYKLDNIINILF
ncbi:MAG: flagellin lysine-N-methylase [Acutalibacteraceae bacterium]|nr:flagellin lysine-N-methylase [Acutalibacteraceae bacterium]